MTTIILMMFWAWMMIYVKAIRLINFTISEQARIGLRIAKTLVRSRFLLRELALLRHLQRSIAAETAR